MKLGKEINVHDQTSVGNVAAKRGYGKVNKDVGEIVADQKENISFLITMNQNNLVHAQVKDRGTKRFSMIAFFFLGEITKEMF